MSSNKLNEILKIVSANSEESIDDFLDLLKPENKSRDEMSQTFEDTLGYDPISFFDKRDSGSICDNLLNDPDTPDEVVAAIKNHRNELVDNAYEIFAESRDSAFLPAAMEEAIEEMTGIEVDILVDEEDDDDEDTDEYSDDEEEDDYGDEEED